MNGRRRKIETALAVIGALDVSELGWDLVHGSPGTHWGLKVTMLVFAVIGIAGVRAFGRRRSSR